MLMMWEQVMIRKRNKMLQRMGWLCQKAEVCIVVVVTLTWVSYNVVCMYTLLSHFLEFEHLAAWLTTAGSCLRPVDMVCGQLMSIYMLPQTQNSYGDRSFAVTGPSQWNHLPPLCNVNLVMNSLNNSWRRYYSGTESTALCDSSVCSALKIHLLTDWLTYMLVLASCSHICICICQNGLTPFPSHCCPPTGRGFVVLWWSWMGQVFGICFFAFQVHSCFFLVVSMSAVYCLVRLVSEMIGYVLDAI